MIKLYKSYEPLPIVPAPDDCLEVHLPLPYRRGNYRFKFKKIGEPTGADTIVVMAYTRLVRVTSSEGYNHFRPIPVTPYKRRIKMYYYKQAEQL
jgi:hypothetical protein